MKVSIKRAHLEKALWAEDTIDVHGKRFYLVPESIIIEAEPIEEDVKITKKQLDDLMDKLWGSEKPQEWEKKHPKKL